MTVAEVARLRENPTFGKFGYSHNLFYSALRIKLRANIKPEAEAIGLREQSLTGYKAAPPPSLLTGRVGVGEFALLACGFIPVLRRTTMEKIFAITILICLMIIASVAYGKTIYVDDDNTSGPWDGTPEHPYQYIQNGINAAVDGDIVQVADGIYTDKGPETNTYLHTDGKAITITSENGPENCIIDCKNANPDRKKAFSLRNTGEDYDTVISGFTMTGGSKANGGAISCQGASPTITNNKIINNSATTQAGGAIICIDFASPTITDNFIAGNSAAGSGGAIACTNGSNPTIENNTITGNSAAVHGGAITCDHSSPEIINNIITDNKAIGNGGAILCFYNYAMVIINNVIIDAGTPAIIANNIITENSAEGYGGAIVSDHANPTITNNIIAGNSALSNGGAIVCSYYAGADSTITYNTITDNSAVDYGGGLVCYQGVSPTVLNTIFWSNTAVEGSAIYLSSATINIDYSDVQGGEAGIGGSGTINWGENNIDLEPRLDMNYHLTDYSPCIGAGTNTPVTDKDIDGETRPSPNGPNPDIGADENPNRDTPLPRGDVSGNGSVTAYDASLVLRHVVGLINLAEAPFPNGAADVGADVTGNKVISALDAALILQYTVGLITKFPAENGTGAPTLNAQSPLPPFEKGGKEGIEFEKGGKGGIELLSDAISTLEKISLDREQAEVVKQLKYFLVGNIPPIHTILLQNYPNPFNPETWLPYNLAQDARVTIRIYNAKGQLIRALHLGKKQAGRYITREKAAYWDGRDNLGQRVASGVYFYTLQTENYTETRRMVILK